METDLRKVNLKGLSQTTQDQMKKVEAYKPSQSVTAAQQTFEATQGAKPQNYQSRYDGQIQAAYDKIMNRDSFKYDMNADPQYQQYKNQFIGQGRRAMMDAQGQAAALTGGYGSSYGVTAGSQAYQQYLESLNEVIPTLYQQAYDRYNQQGQDLLSQYEMALGADERDYSRWTDAYNRWAQELARAENTYNTERNFDYGQFADNRNYWQQMAQMENANYWQGRDQAYQLAMTMLQAGQTPSAEMLYAAGIGDEDLAKLQSLYAPKKSGGSRKTPTTVDILAALGEEAYNNSGFNSYQALMQGAESAFEKDTMNEVFARGWEKGNALDKEVAKRQAEQEKKQSNTLQSVLNRIKSK